MTCQHLTDLARRAIWRARAYRLTGNRVNAVIWLDYAAAFRSEAARRVNP